MAKPRMRRPRHASLWTPPLRRPPRPLVLWDFDEIFFPFIMEILNFYNQLRGTNFTVDDITSYDFDVVWGTTREESNRLVDEFMELDHSAILPLDPNARELLAEIGQVYDQGILTARADLYEVATRNWANLHLDAEAHFQHMVLAGNEFTGRPYRTKGEVARELGAVCLVDDSAANIADAVSHGVPGLLYGNYTWNQVEPPPGGWCRVHSLDEVATILLARQLPQLPFRGLTN